MMIQKRKHPVLGRILITTSLFLALSLTLEALAAEKKPHSPAPSATPALSNDPERVNVENIKEKYWARGDTAEIGVVQNRLYSKAKKFQLGAYTGFLSSDPFLSTRTYGLSMGYHFNEYVSFHAVGWRALANPSSALETFQATKDATANTNPSYWYFGGEMRASLLYGKLSVVGKSIIYYDMHILGGLGITQTEGTSTVVGQHAANPDNNFTQHIGLGQQVYLSKSMSLSIDYRAMHYQENIKEKTIPTKLYTSVGTRSNWNHVISVGVNFMFGFLGGDSSK